MKLPRIEFKPVASIRASPRLLPEFRRQTWNECRPFFRVSLLFGPPLALLAWLVVRHLEPDAADATLLITLLAASLAFLIGAAPLFLLLQHPRWGCLLLPKLKIWHGGLMVSNDVMVPWKQLRSLRIEPGEGEFAETELALHVERFLQGRPQMLSLVCLRSDVDPALLARLSTAIENQKWPDA